MAEILISSNNWCIPQVGGQNCQKKVLLDVERSVYANMTTMHAAWSKSLLDAKMNLPQEGKPQGITFAERSQV